MPPLIRHRRATMAVAALFAGAPPLVSSMAAAGPPAVPEAPVPESGHEVVFTGGGLFGVRCAARPSRGSVTVPAEGVLRVVNDTSRRARLILDGVAQGELPDGSAAEVLVHRGPVSLVLRPICLSAAVSAVRVEVDTAPGCEAPGAPERVFRADPGISDRPGAAQARTSDVAAPAAARRGGGPPPLANGPAAEASSSVEPLRGNGPVGLLALIAAICVIGVSTGAIRAIIAQRITRTVVA